MRLSYQLQSSMAVASTGNAVARAIPEPSPGEIWFRLGAYQVRLAASDEDRAAVYRLRFRVFNLELNEGLEAAFQSGEDRDEFDAVCDHLMVEHAGSRQVIGTYRLQSGHSAGQNLGYYSAREFEFAPYDTFRDSILELGRACVHREHRSMQVLTLLWRGIAIYSQRRGLRYLVGCSSLTSQDVHEGAAMYRRLQEFLVDPWLRTVPTPRYAFPLEQRKSALPKPPKLLRAYLAIGAKICGPPAIDREFGTIDFLTWLDLKALSWSAKARFLG